MPTRSRRASDPYSGVLSPRSTPIACLVSLTMQHLMGINPVVYEGKMTGVCFAM
ncbi:hypothetical protein [Pseudomonas peli]|uniref:hypothetical protein n=1 Tax=Pseudomonas peli TaxID=592361 RepID=UPI0024AE5870|nr:hypothetical protein [Pseudomonas peli]